MANPTPAQVAQAREIAERIDSAAVAFDACGEQSFADVLQPIIATALATAHAEGRQAALEEAEAAVGRVLVPTAFVRMAAAAEVADWQQVVLNGGPPCFHLAARGNFCLRAERWFGHHCDSPDHEFVSLAAALARLRATTPTGELK